MSVPVNNTKTNNNNKNNKHVHVQLKFKNCKITKRVSHMNLHFATKIPFMNILIAHTSFLEVRCWYMYSRED